MSRLRTGRFGVLGRAAHRAGHTVGQLAGQLRRDAAQPLFAQGQPLLVCAHRALSRRGQGRRSGLLLLTECVTPSCRLQPPPGRVEPGRQLLRPGRGVLCGLHAFPQGPVGGVPAGQPLRRLLDQFVVRAGLTLQAGPFGVDLPAPALGTACGLERAQLRAEAAFPVGQLAEARVGQLGRQTGAGPCQRSGRGAVGPLGLVTQFESRGHQVRLAGTGQLLVAAVPFRAAVLQTGGTAAGLLVPLLEPGQFAFRLGQEPGGVAPPFRRGQHPAGDVEPFTGAAARDGRPSQDRLGEPGLARPFLGGRLLRGRSGRLREAMGQREDLLVPCPDPGFGRPSQLGQALLDGGEPAGVEETAEELSTRLRVGPQEPREVPLRQQHHLAELVPAHPDEPADLIADLLVGAAQRLPAVLGVVLPQPALRLLGREAAAPLLGAGLGRPPGDLEPAPPDRQLQAYLGRPVHRGVVTAQRGAGALPGPGHRPVEAVADGVEHGGLARAGGAVQQEDPGRGQGVEVDFLGGAERAERGQGEPVQPQRDTSPITSSIRTSSNTARSTVRSWSLGPLPPRTWATKSSATCWSSRPSSRCA